MIVVLSLLIGLAGLGYLWVKRRYSFWTDRGFVSPPSSFPFGSMKQGENKNDYEQMREIYTNFKGRTPAVGIYLFTKPTVLVIDPELCKNILIRDFASFHDRDFFVNKEDDPTSANLLTLKGQEWRNKRVKMTPIFTSGKMKTMFDIVDMIGERLITQLNLSLKTSNVQDLKSFSGKYTGDVIGNAVFGLECRCLEDPDSQFLKYGRRVFDFTKMDILQGMISIICPALARKLGFGLFPKEATSFFLQTFLKTFEYREKNNIERNDFISLLLSLKGLFTKEELAAEGFLVYVGGFESSSTLVTFTTYELAMNQDIQDRLRAEIMEGLNENDGKLTYDMLFGFKYLNMVVSESLRKYPPIPNQDRECNKEYKIPGTELVIPKGAHIEVVMFAIQNDPEYFPEPEKFDPERFTPEMVKDRNPMTYMPFGDGPRNCIGMRFALLQAKLGIVKLIQNYKLTPSEKTPIPMKFEPDAPFLTPIGGMHLTMTKIE